MPRCSIHPANDKPESPQSPSVTGWGADNKIAQENDDGASEARGKSRRLSNRKTPRVRRGTELYSFSDKRKQPRVSVGEWAQVSTNWALEMSGKKAQDAAGSFPPSPLCTTSRLGTGGGVGNLEGPNGKEGKEGAEAEVGVATSTDQRPANERRFEPVLHPIQKIFVPVINSDPFYYVIMGAIFVNCIQLATTSPLDDDPQGMKDMYEVIDWILSRSSVLSLCSSTSLFFITTGVTTGISSMGPLLFSLASASGPPSETTLQPEFCVLFGPFGCWASSMV